MGKQPPSACPGAVTVLGCFPGLPPQPGPKQGEFPVASDGISWPNQAAHQPKTMTVPIGGITAMNHAEADKKLNLLQQTLDQEKLACAELTGIVDTVSLEAAAVRA